MSNMNHELTSAEIALLKRQKVKELDEVQLIGKPTTNFKDFFKRLFSKKLTIASIIVFFGLIIAAVIIQLISDLSPTENIKLLQKDGTLADPKNFLISSLPPTAKDGGNVEMVVSSSQYSLLINTPDLKMIGAPTVLGPDKIHIIFNPYNYFDSSAFSHGGNTNFILGTNTAGQDNWVRVWAGTLESIKLALLVAIAETVVGIAIGAYLGLHAGSWVDTILMRIIDTIAGVPTLLWFILLSFMLPPGFWTLFAALTLVGWIAPVYQTRMYVLRVKNLDFIKAAKTTGVPKWKLVYKYALPQSLGRILSQFVRRIPIVIFAQASLAFLGFSNADDFNLGAVINDAKSHLDNVWYLLTPTFIIFTITLSLQFIANGINDALEPKLGGQ